MDHFEEMFINLPGYTFLQALFLSGLDRLNIPINVFTYRIFQLSVVTLLLCGTTFLLARIAQRGPTDSSLKINVFLVMLGVSPFVIDVLSQRPEALGLLATVLAIIAYDLGCTTENSGHWFLWLVGFFLGTATAMHPTFALTSGGVGAVAIALLLRQSNYKGLVGAVVFGLVPPLLVVAWFAADWPQSWNMLAEHATMTRIPSLDSLGDGLALIFQYALFGYERSGSFAVTAYYAALFSVLAIVLGIVLVLTFRRLKVWRERPENGTALLIATFFFMALVNVSIVRSPRFQIYTVLAFAAVLALTVFMPLLARDAGKRE